MNNCSSILTKDCHITCTWYDVQPATATPPISDIGNGTRRHCTDLTRCSTNAAANVDSQGTHLLMIWQTSQGGRLSFKSICSCIQKGRNGRLRVHIATAQ
jgi:hypothetical protein